MLEATNTAATVIGYVAIIGLAMLVFWFFRMWHEAWAYKRRRRRKQDQEMDTLHAMLMSGQVSTYRTDTLDQEVVSQDYIQTTQFAEVSPDRIDTDVLNETFDQITTYQKENAP